MSDARPINPQGEDSFSPAMADASRYMAWVLEPFHNYIGGRIVEIGVGHGGYGEYLKSAEEFVGLDISETSIEKLKQQNPHREYLAADITDSATLDSLKNRTFDTVICLNVLEHIQDDEKAVQNMLGLLAPGGHVLLFVPAYQALYSEMDRLAGHYRRYQISAFYKMAEALGAEIVHAGYFNSIGGIGWWINKLNKPRSLGDTSVNFQLQFFDRYLVPVARTVDHVTRKFFGQSVYVVLKKKDRS